jgi:hypothetical protein
MEYGIGVGLDVGVGVGVGVDWDRDDKCRYDRSCLWRRERSMMMRRTWTSCTHTNELLGVVAGGSWHLMPRRREKSKCVGYRAIGLLGRRVRSTAAMTMNGEESECWC